MKLCNLRLFLAGAILATSVFSPASALAQNKKPNVVFIRFGWSLSNLAALLRQQLFVYRDLLAWIDEPFQPPQLLDPGAEQLALSW